MTSVRFDHFITYASAASVEDHLTAYAAQGFLPSERTVRHDPGLRNGFVFIGPEYLEFCWVEDEALFAAADAEEKLLRSMLRPFGLGIVADDVQAVHDDWTRRGYAVPEVTSGRPRDASPDSPPLWSFQDIPGELLPGVSSFVLTYHARSRDEVRVVKIAPNTVYAVSGVTFVTTEPETRATHWRDLLAPAEHTSQSGTSFHVWIGPHRVTWMAPDAYRSAYGLSWMPLPQSQGELALLHLLATDAQAAQRMLELAGRQTSASRAGGEGEFLVAPHPGDGFAFTIKQQDAAMWLRERVGRTGERLSLAQE